jgi:hypothetical protein
MTWTPGGFHPQKPAFSVDGLRADFIHKNKPPAWMDRASGGGRVIDKSEFLRLPLSTFSNSQHVPPYKDK